MITIFNRKEAYITFRPEDHFRAKEILSANGIEHYTKFGGSNPVSGGRRRGYYSPRRNDSCQYTIYVHKKDLEKATRLIRK